MLKEVITATGSTLSLLVHAPQGSIRQTVTVR
jgi:hypothetical protein